MPCGVHCSVTFWTPQGGMGMSTHSGVCCSHSVDYHLFCTVKKNKFFNTVNEHWFHIHSIMETENKTDKGKTKGLHREILKTGLLHKDFCVKKLWKVQRDKWKKRRCLHRDAKNRMCGLDGSALVGYFQKWNNGPHMRILCSTWNPQENSLEKGIIEQQ